MKRHIVIVLANAIVAASIFGCASKPPDIALTSSDFDLNPLVGEWRGTYTNPVAGTFASLPEGAPLSVSGQSFHITYAGGRGYDVVLVASAAVVLLLAPRRPLSNVALVPMLGPGFVGAGGAF